MYAYAAESLQSIWSFGADSIDFKYMAVALLQLPFEY